MKAKLQKKLIDKYPKFFEYLSNFNGPIIPIQFGFEIGNGWYWLLDELMDNIYSYCIDNEKQIPNVTQIKEKYGRLCFYIQGGNDMIDGMIWLAESMSYNICETCGTNKNVGHTEGWIYTSCKSCIKKNKRAKGLKFNLNQ